MRLRTLMPAAWAAVASGVILAVAIPATARDDIMPATARDDVPLPFQGLHCTTTLLDAPARPLVLPAEFQRRLDQDLQIAQAMVRIAPDREESHIWLGRRLSYLGRQCEAIDAFSRGLQQFPDSHKLLRFRAQTLTRVRAFDRALADFQRAAQLAGAVPDRYEPDGLPNAQNLMLGTYRTNIHYYMAQTRWATGDYRGLVADMDASLALMPAHLLAEHQIPTTFWRYLALRKLGDTVAAQGLLDQLPEGIEPVEAAQYLRAVQLMQGRLTPADLADDKDSLVRFALAMKSRFDGNDAEAQRRLRALIEETPGGYWPAEIELTAPDRG